MADSGKTNPEEKDHQTVGKCQQVVSILWPSFIMAAFACTLFWVIIDPDEFRMISGFNLPRTGLYTVSFFVSWAITALSSFLSIRFCTPSALVKK